MFGILSLGTESKLTRRQRGDGPQAHLHSIKSDRCQGPSKLAWT